MRAEPRPEASVAGNKPDPPLLRRLDGRRQLPDRVEHDFVKVPIWYLKRSASSMVSWNMKSPVGRFLLGRKDEGRIPGDE